MTSQFVILHHTGHGEEHWDLMLEHGDVLLTWQLLAEPVSRAALPIAARRIADHRKAYLDYEGPISGGRGQVRRIDRGPLEIKELTEVMCVFSAEGTNLKGNHVLKMGVDQTWSLDALSSPAD